MKIKLLLVTILMIGFSLSGIAQKKNKKAQQTEQQGQITDSISYAFGAQIAESLKSGDIIDGINISQFVLAFEDLKQNKSKITKEEAYALISTFLQDQFVKRKEENLKKGNEFLEQNKTKDGVVFLASGLQYKILQHGAGNKPKVTDEVEVHYKGTLLDGTQFDSSYDRNESAKFVLNRVIPGWTEGLQQIQEGGKIMLFVPPALGYGENGMQGSPIGPNSALIFEIELLKVSPVAQQAPQQGQSIEINPRSLVPAN